MIFLENTAISCKCPSCGGELVWDGGKHLFNCGWCGSEITEAQARSEGGIIDQNRQEADSFANDTNVYVCSSCGAEVICDRNTAASFCYYCHSPVALSGRLSGDYRPEMIIPFQLNREQAEAAFRAHCMKKWFLPSDFLTSSQIEKMTGLYVPFWLADCKADAFILAEGKQITRYYSGRSTVVNTKIYNADRSAKLTYMGIPADGSRKIDDSIINAIEPYDYNMLRDFDISYLSGFYCDKYDVSKEEVLEIISRRLEEGAEEMLKSTVTGYDEVSVKEKTSMITDIKWHYMSLPVWFMTYKHHGKFYSFAINGQTGKTAGILPVSRFKLGLFALLLGIIFAVLGYTIGDLLL